MLLAIVAYQPVAEPSIRNNPESLTAFTPMSTSSNIPAIYRPELAP